MTIEEVKEIINKEEISDVEIIAVIEQYILDTKGVTIKINRPSGAPCISLFHTHGVMIDDVHLMWIMFVKCIEYYGEKD